MEKIINAMEESGITPDKTTLAFVLGYYAAKKEFWKSKCKRKCKGKKY
jgi:hypothetical protein